MLKIKNLKTNLIGPINLSVSGGECIVVHGASGSGKSLMLRAIVDLDQNDGDVFLDGLSRNHMLATEWRRLVSMVPAESGWWSGSVRDHFQYSPSVQHLFNAVGLRSAIDWQISRLSTGERQRLALIRALQYRPKVLLLDEPTSALDERSTNQIERLLNSECENGTAIILVTHDTAQAARIGSRCFAMTSGHLKPATRISQ